MFTLAHIPFWCTQAEPMASGRGTERSTSLSRRLALQQRLDAKPVAVHQQIRRETQAQVLSHFKAAAKAADWATPSSLACCHELTFLLQPHQQLG